MGDQQENGGPTALDNRVVILNGFTQPEIVAIMNIVKALYADTNLEAFYEYATAAIESEETDEFMKRVLKVIGAAKQLPETQNVSTKDLIFAMTTENSLQMKLADLIEDMSEDHEYLKNNPPNAGTGSGEGT
jgi:hypothetical protein